MQTINSEMNNISQAFISKVYENLVNYNMKLTRVAPISGGKGWDFRTHTDIDCTIKRATVALGNGSGSSFENFSVGDVYANTFEAELFGVTDDLTDALICVHVGVELSGGVYEYVPIGYFFVTTYKKIKDFYTLSATSFFSKFYNTEAFDSADWYYSSNLFLFIKKFIGGSDAGTTYGGGEVDWSANSSFFPQNGSSIQVPIQAGSTIRSALEVFATSIGAYVFETVTKRSVRIGSGSAVPSLVPTLNIVKNTTAVSVRPNADALTKDPELEDKAYIVDGLIIKAHSGSNTEWTYDTGKVNVELDFCNQAMADTIWNNIRNYTFYPGAVTVATIDPRVQPTDCIRALVLEDDTWVEKPCSARGIYATYDGGYFGRYSSSGLSDTGKDVFDGTLSKKISVAIEAATEAARAAEAVNQHFWHSSDGAHVTDEEREDYENAESRGFPDYQPDPELPAYRPWYAVVLNSLGQLFKTAKYILASFTHSAIAFYDGLWDGTGNGASHVVAAFGKAGAQIGMRDKSHIDLDYHSFQMSNKEGDTYMHVSDLRDDTGYSTDITEVAAVSMSTVSGQLQPTIWTAIKPIYDVRMTVVSSQASGAEVTGTVIASEGKVHSLVYNTGQGTAPVEQGWDVRIVYKTTSKLATAYTLGFRKSGADIGACSFATGDDAEASAFSAAAFGEGRAAGEFSLASGTSSAYGNYSQAHGIGCLAYGANSHAEGWQCRAGKDDIQSNYVLCAYAKGRGVVAAGECQVAIGRWNIEDTTSVLIIGNGSSNNNRRNALAVDFNGNVSLAGAVILQSGTTFTSANASTWRTAIGANNASNLSAGTVPRARIENTSWAYLYGTSSSTDKYVRWRMVAGIVFIEFYYSSGAGVTSGGTSFGTIPSGYRPSKRVDTTCYGSGNNVLWVDVNTTGAITVGHTSSGSTSDKAYGSISYPLG